ncbi:IclR family transcriptional regulator [Schaalia naturae]|jgi:DNA-binding IclR family transcriptional regulator|uniref:IclR family transcriptional regulator n=1 Tax=Schaalia naturae TaxID=635203 RepID=A0ABW2SJE8_9ACTO
MEQRSRRPVDRTLDLLTLVCRTPGLSLSECARAAEIPISSAQRHLQALEASEYVARDREGGYRPGFLLMKLGAASLSQDNLIWVASRYMRDIVSRTGESVYLAVEGTAQFGLYIHVIEGTHSVRHANWVGRTIPLAESAVGKVLLGEVPLGEFTMVEGGVEDDVTAIAAPIRRAGAVNAALNLVVPRYRMTAEKTDRYGSALAEAGVQISCCFEADLPIPSAPVSGEPR